MKNAIFFLVNFPSKMVDWFPMANVGIFGVVNSYHFWNPTTPPWGHWRSQCSREAGGNRLRDTFAYRGDGPLGTWKMIVWCAAKRGWHGAFLHWKQMYIYMYIYYIRIYSMICMYSIYMWLYVHMSISIYIYTYSFKGLKRGVLSYD